MRYLAISIIFALGFNQLNASEQKTKKSEQPDSISTAIEQSVFLQNQDFLDPDSILISGKNLVDNYPLILFFDKCKLGEPVVPCNTNVISSFGIRRGRMHTGTDIKLQKGDNIYAMFNGVVTRSSSYYGYGNLIVVNHGDGLETYYGHLTKRFAAVGDTVAAGDVIGSGGRTGRATTDHLHFEIRVNGKPYDAEKIFAFGGITEKSNVFGMKVPMVAVQKDKPNSTSTDTEVAADDETPDGTEKIHIIKKGETLYSISKKYGTTVNKLCALNKLTSRSKLSIGNKVRIK